MVFWGLRLLVRAPVAPAYAVVVGDVAATRGDLAGLLGSAPVVASAEVAAVPAPAAASRFKLFGIVAPKSARGDATAKGVALIAVDGKMPKAYAVGASIDADLVLKSVSLRTVSIGTAPGGAPITLELPPPAAAATGPLPANMPLGMPVPTPMAVAPPPVAMPQGVPQPMVPQNSQGLPNRPVPILTPQPPLPGAARPEITAPVQ